MSNRFVHRFVKPSTIALLVEGIKTPGYSLLDWLHGYVYARWPYLYIGIATGEHPLARRLATFWGWLGGAFLALNFGKHKTGRQQEQATFADTYHGKVVPYKAAHQLVSVKEDVRLTNLEKIIPYTRARDIILKNPDHIVVLKCPCRAARKNPCLPLEVCLIIGEPFASFVSEHHPERSRVITSAEAIEIITAEHQRGHVQHAFFKDAMLQRFYAICNCCACCCGAMQAHQHGTPMLASSGYVCKVGEDLCIACGDCTNACQFSALTLSNTCVSVDYRACMGCGVCVSQCEQGALELVREPAKGEPLEIFALMSNRSS